MRHKVKLGYEVGSGKEIVITPSHLIVTGITQQSGKTTTLEALLSRSHLRAVVFKTKIGEKSFSEGKVMQPFFRNRSDYEFVKSLIEAYAKEKLMIEKGVLMSLCKDTKSLEDIQNKVCIAIEGGKLRGIEKEIYTRLNHYLDNLISQLRTTPLSAILQIKAGINVMNLEGLSEEVQSLIIQSVAHEVLMREKDVVIVIPEAWKFIPQRYSNPCKRAVEAFIRQGATNNNFIWIDSQDMAGVDKTLLKQVSTWILGYQAERNEVKHTLDQIPLPKSERPTVDDIMGLGIGHFVLASREKVARVYVQPTWLLDKQAKDIAMGKTKVEEIRKKESLSGPVPGIDNIEATRNRANSQPQNMYELLLKEINEVRKEMHDMAATNYLSNRASSMVGDIPSKMQIEQIAKHVAQLLGTAGAGNPVYQVSPIEAIKKRFLQEAKDKISSDVSGLKPDSKKALRYIESCDTDITNNEIVTKCFFLKPGGSAAVKVSGIFSELTAIDAIQKTQGGRYRKGLRARIIALLGNHNATEQEIQTTYDHIIADLLTNN